MSTANTTPDSIPAPLPEEKGAKYWCIGFWLVVAAGLMLHVLQLSDRPFHHDEAVNGWFLHNMMVENKWKYDPTNYHGPFLWYFHAMMATFIKISESGLRLPVAVAASMIPVFLVGFRHWMGWSGLFFTALMLTCSPVMLYYGRTFIHEIYLAISLVLLIVVAHRYALWRMTADWLALWAILGLIMAIKETGLISVIIMGIAVLMADAVACLRIGKLPQTQQMLAKIMPPGDTGDERFKNLIIGIIVWQFLLALYFTNFFKHWEGWIDIWRAYAVWFDTGTSGQAHQKPFIYYLKDVLWMQSTGGGSWIKDPATDKLFWAMTWLKNITWVQEGPLVMLGVFGGAVSLWRGQRLGLFLAAWSAGTLLAYSIVDYKTPWLAVQMALPLALLSGWALGQCWVMLVRKHWLVPAPLLLLAVAGAGWMGKDAYRLAYQEWDQHANPYIYAHTNADAAAFLDMMDEMGHDPEARTTRFALMAPGMWPMPWYVRNWKATGFWDRDGGSGWPERIDDDMVMVENGKYRELLKLIPGTWHMHTMTLRPGLPGKILINDDSWDKLYPWFERNGYGDQWQLVEGLAPEKAATEADGDDAQSSTSQSWTETSPAETNGSMTPQEGDDMLIPQPAISEGSVTQPELQTPPQAEDDAASQPVDAMTPDGTQEPDQATTPDQADN